MICAFEDCAGALRSDNRSGYCTDHRHRAAKRIERARDYYRRRYWADREPAPICKIEGCGRRLSRGDISRLCLEHIRGERSTCKMRNCEAKINRGNLIGYCRPHRKMGIGERDRLYLESLPESTRDWVLESRRLAGSPY